MSGGTRRRSAVQRRFMKRHASSRTGGFESRRMRMKATSWVGISGVPIAFSVRLSVAGVRNEARWRRKRRRSWGVVAAATTCR